MALTRKQEGFAVAVAKGEKASDAYRAAYNASGMTSKTIHESASRVLANSKVSARIAELVRAPALAAAGLEVDRVLRECAWLAHQDPGRLFDEAGNPVPIHKLPADVRATISSIEFDRETGAITKVRFWDKNAALDKAMKHLGVFERDNSQRMPNLMIEVQLVGPAREASGSIGPSRAAPIIEIVPNPQGAGSR